MREALFALIGPVEGAAVLDLFAGSGALGLEALSRGAATATFVDRPRGRSRRSAPTSGRSGSRTARAWWAGLARRLAAQRAAGRRFGLCLCDPPYSLLPRIAGSIGAALAPS